MSYGRGIHNSLRHLEFGVDLVPGWSAFPFWGQPGQNGAPPALVLLHPGWTILYGLEVSCLRWGSSIVVPPLGDGPPGRHLRGVVIHLCHTVDGPSRACGGSPPSPLGVNAMQEDREAPGGRPRPGLSGPDFHAPGWYIMSPIPRRQHHRGLLYSDLLDSQKR